MAVVTQALRLPQSAKACKEHPSDSTLHLRLTIILAILQVYTIGPSYAGKSEGYYTYIKQKNNILNENI